jgi:hypothetical protein
MTKEEALRKLTAAYDVQPFDKSSKNWVVTSKNGPPYRRIGTVVFNNERLVVVSRSWGPANQTARALAAALTDAVQSASEQQRACTVAVETVTVGSQTVIECGTHRITVLVPKDSKYGTGIDETIRSR